MLLHRNSQKRFYAKNYIYFITTNTRDWFDYFKEPLFCDLLIDNLQLCGVIKCFELYGFCVLYDHVHLLIKPGDRYNISEIMQNFKMNCARNLNKIMGYETPNEGANTYSRLHLEWMRKCGYKIYQIPKFRWQKSYHDHVIRGPCDFGHHYSYTVHNYLKHDLPKNWKCTSLNYKEMIDTMEL